MKIKIFTILVILLTLFGCATMMGDRTVNVTGGVGIGAGAVGSSTNTVPLGRPDVISNTISRFNCVARG